MDLVEVQGGFPFPLHWPGYNYLGPFTPISASYVVSHPPVNWLDELAMNHDISYTAAMLSRNANWWQAARRCMKADMRFIEGIEAMLRDSRLPAREVFAARVARSVMNLKIMMWNEVDQSSIDKDIENDRELWDYLWSDMDAELRNSVQDEEKVGLKRLDRLFRFEEAPLKRILPHAVVGEKRDVSEGKQHWQRWKHWREMNRELESNLHRAKHPTWYFHSPRVDRVVHATWPVENLKFVHK